MFYWKLPLFDEMHVQIYAKTEQIFNRYYTQPLHTLCFLNIGGALLCPVSVLSVFLSLSLEEITKGMKLHQLHVIMTLKLALKFVGHYKGLHNARTAFLRKLKNVI